MNDIELNDFIIEILQDIIELESSLKVLKDATYSKSNEISMIDVSNNLEIIIAKIYNTKISLDKYIDTVFCKE